MTLFSGATQIIIIGIILIALGTNTGASESDSESIINSVERTAKKLNIGGGSLGDFEFLQLDGQLLLSPNLGIEAELYLGAGIGGASFTMDSRDLFDFSGLDLILTGGAGLADQEVNFGSYGNHKTSLTQYSGGALLSYLLDSSKANNYSFKGFGMRHTTDGSLSEEERIQMGVEGASGYEIHTGNFKLGSGRQWKSEFSALLNNGFAATLKRERFDDQLDGSQNLDSGWMVKMGLHKQLSGDFINYDVDAGYAFDVDEFVYDASVSAGLLGGRLGARIADSVLGKQKEMFFTHSCFTLEVFDKEQRDGDDELGAMLSYSFQCSSVTQGQDKSLAAELSERWQDRNMRISKPVYGSGMRVLIAAATRPVRAELTSETIETVNPIDNPPQALISGFPLQLLAGSRFTLDGSSSTDAEGAIAGYSWQSGGECSIEGVADGVAITLVVAAQATSCSAILTVMDSAGQTDSATVQGVVTVPQNTPPTAIIRGVPNTVLASASLQVSGDSSTDAEGSISSYLWRASGSCSVSGSNVDSNSTIQISANVVPGDTCTVELTVTDSGGLTDSTQVQTIVANNTNTAPTAVITGLTATALASDSFNLSGASSSDAEGAISSYLWNASGSCSLSGSTSAATATLDIAASAVPGNTCTVSLTVTDSGGLSDTAQAQTTITTPANTAPTAVITGLAATTLASDSFNLSGASSSDAEGAISSYLWNASGSCSLSGSTSAATATLDIAASAVPGNTCTVSLTVTDSGGLTDTAQAQTTIAAPTNTAPTAVITGLAATALASDSFNLSGASSSDAEGAISSYSWNASGSCSISGSTSAATATLNIASSAIPGDTCTVSLTVTDSGGLTDTAQAQTTITAPPNTAPTAVISITSTTVFGGATQYTLDGSGSSDAEGAIASYNWSLTGVCSFGATPSGVTTSVIATAGASCTVSLTVTDSGGLTNTVQRVL